MSYRDDPNDTRETEIENLLKERALLSAHPTFANQSKIRYINALLDSLQSEAEGEEVQQEIIHEVPKPTFKEKAIDTLGGFGFVLYFLIRLMIAVLPFVMIGGNFFLTLLLASINYFIPITSVVFWIWGLVCAIQGVQDVWAIMFYIAFVVVWIPFLVSTTISMFSKK